jgi:nitroreductase
VKLVNDPDLVKGALKIQTGLNATADTVRQLFVITVDRSVFVSSAEWYQGFIDGGIFLQNILYALHFYKIAAVPLNWSKHFYLDVKLHKLLQIPKSEKIIALTAIGYPQDLFQVPFSKRKEVSELLKIIE